MEALPPELYERIFSYLTACELYQLGLTCKKLYAATADEAVWTNAIRRSYLIPQDQIAERSSLHPRQLFVRLLKDYGNALGFWSVKKTFLLRGCEFDSFMACSPHL